MQRIPALIVAAVLLLSAPAWAQEAIDPQRKAKVLASLAAMADDPEGTALEAVERAVARIGKDIEGQSEVLARLAWPTEPLDEEISSIARRKLVEYGDDGIPSMYRTLLRAGPVHSADVIRAVREAFEVESIGIPPYYKAAMIEALWSGSREARVLAMETLALHRDPSGLLSIIDSVHEYPSLAPTAVECLGKIGNDRARFFLDELLRGSDAKLRRAAADAMARIGGEARGLLVVAMAEEDPAIYRPAALALAPMAGPGELTALHEFVLAHDKDDPETVAPVREAARRLEELIEANTIRAEEEG